MTASLLRYALCSTHLATRETALNYIGQQETPDNTRHTKSKQEQTNERTTEKTQRKDGSHNVTLVRANSHILVANIAWTCCPALGTEPGPGMLFLPVARSER